MLLEGRTAKGREGDDNDEGSPYHSERLTELEAEFSDARPRRNISPDEIARDEISVTIDGEPLRLSIADADCLLRTLTFSFAYREGYLSDPNWHGFKWPRRMYSLEG